MSLTFIRSIARTSTARTLGLALTSAFVSQATTERDRLMGHEEKNVAQDEHNECYEDSDNDTSNDTDADDDCDSDISDESDKVKVRRAQSSASASSPQRQPRNPGASVEHRNHHKPPVFLARHRHSSYTHAVVSCQSNSHASGVHDEHRCCCQKSTAPTEPPVRTPPVRVVLDGSEGLELLFCIINISILVYVWDRYT